MRKALESIGLITSLLFSKLYEMGCVARKSGWWVQTDAEEFITKRQNQMSSALSELDSGLPSNPHVQILSKNKGWIRLSPLKALAEPPNLACLKAETEAILNRFTRQNLAHPTYRALAELGKALKTLFLCQYLQLEPTRREIHEGLNVVESSNSANNFIFYGKGQEITTNRREDQEIAVLSLHLLQSCLVYINTLMI